VKEKMSFKLDLHVHTQSFGRTFMNEDQLRIQIKARGLDGIAVTNFFNISHALWLKAKLPEYIIIVGQEIWTADGHMIGLGLREKIQDSLSAKETVKCIHDQGGIAIAVHPYLFLGIGDKVKDTGVDAIEIYNAAVGSVWVFNFLALRYLTKLPVGKVASSDTSDYRHIGESYTEVLAQTPEQILSAIKHGETKLHKRPLPFPFFFIMKNVLKFRNLEPCPLHAAVCFICGKSMSVRLFNEKFRCHDCHKTEFTRIACCNGHYFCRECLAKRISARDDITRYAREKELTEVAI
jgi:predicted metal-dependent phosphoesterase TrpH